MPRRLDAVALVVAREKFLERHPDFCGSLGHDRGRREYLEETLRRCIGAYLDVAPTGLFGRTKA